MNDKRYLQLSISALVTAIVIELGWIVGSLKPTQILLFKGFLLIISILIGIFFFLSYKYKINYSKIGLLNGFVEKVNEVIPETAKGLTLILGIIIVVQVAFVEDPPPTPTSTPICCVTCWGKLSTIDTCTPPPKTPPTIPPTSTPTYTPTYTPTSTPTITLSPETMGCVDTFGLNVRNSPGVTEDPSNHAQIWLRNDACLTILGTSTTDPEWVHVQFEGFVRLKAGETVYVGTVTPTPTPTPTP